MQRCQVIRNVTKVLRYVMTWPKTTINYHGKYMVVNVQQCSLLHGYAILAQQHFSF